jgi:hypothetical protein
MSLICLWLEFALIARKIRHLTILVPIRFEIFGLWIICEKLLSYCSKLSIAGSRLWIHDVRNHFNKGLLNKQLM